MSIEEILQNNLDLVVGHNSAKNLLIKAVSAGRVRVFLLVGPPHIGKGLLARILAASLHNSLEINRVHRDTISFADILEANKGEKEENKWKKSADDLIKFLSRSPMISKVKVAIIDEIDKLSSSAANALLKTLEEPSKSAIIILTTSNLDAVLPTIKSRAQIIPLNYLSDEEIKKFVLPQTKSRVEGIVIFANGAIGRAKALIQDADLLQKYLNYLANFKVLLSGSVTEGFRMTAVKDRSEALELLTVWLNLSRRLVLSQLNVDKRGGLMEELSKLTQRGADELTELTAEIGKSIEAIDAGANIQIVLEALILHWAWGMAKNPAGYNLG